MADPINILSEDLTNVKTDIPLLAEGTYDLAVKSIEKVQAKDGVNFNLKIKLALTENAQDVDGNVLNVGFPVFDVISLKVTDQYNPRPSLKRFQEACGVSGPFEPLSQYLHKTVRATVKIDQGDPEKGYKPSNRINRYLKVG